MAGFHRSAFQLWIAVLGLLLLGGRTAEAQDQASPASSPQLAEPITEGQRVFTCGHSFHVWVPGIVADLCRLAEIPDHVQLGVSSIGGSRVIQHWDIYEPTTKRPEKVDHNAITGEELRKRHAVHFQKMDEHIRQLNEKYGKTVLYVAPAPQALIALREKIIAGQAPGLKVQEDLFSDELGHGKPSLMALVAYCNYAVIYRRSPVGLPVPAILKQAKLGDQAEDLNRLLQELAWEAVVQHPLSGLRR